MFKPLTEEQVYEIVDKYISMLQDRLKERQIHIELEKDAKELILARAYDVQYGARPVKRYVEKFVETELGRMILKGEIADKDTIKITTENGQLKFNIA